MMRRPLISTLFPYTTLFRSSCCISGRVLARCDCIMVLTCCFWASVRLSSRAIKPMWPCRCPLHPEVLAASFCCAYEKIAVPHSTRANNATATLQNLVFIIFSLPPRQFVCHVLEPRQLDFDGKVW